LTSLKQGNIIRLKVGKSENKNNRFLQEIEMEELVKVREKGQVTLPVFIRKSLDLTKGSIVLAKIVDNTVVLVPQRMIDKDQIWFWTERWQKLEAEAEKDIRKGRVNTFNSVEELFDEIEKNPEIKENRKVQKKRS
jgi:AbrB family looped-hinge helix DNA binding protein